MSRELPYTTPEEEGLDACSRDGYEVTERSRFEDPDAKHDRACPCVVCRFGKRGERVCYDHTLAGQKTPVADCEKCERLNAEPFERGPYPKFWDNGPDYNPPKPEIWPTIRMHGQRSGDSLIVKPKCAKCGLTIEASLHQVGDGWECTNKDVCRMEVASQERVRTRLQLLKGGKP